MKKEAHAMPAVWPLPLLIVSVRDAQGRDNALVVGFGVNCSLEPPMVMIGIMPSRFSHHMLKENPCFVLNYPRADFRKEFEFLGYKSGRDVDKFAALGLRTVNGTRVNAPLLEACPVNIECSVVESITPGSHELFVGKVEAVHCDTAYLDEQGNILWDKMDLIRDILPKRAAKG